MDPALKELCLEVLGENVDSEKFAWLLIETGVNVEGTEWDIANRLLRKGEAIHSLSQDTERSVH